MYDDQGLVCGSLLAARNTHYLMVARGPLAFPALLVMKIMIQTCPKYVSFADPVEDPAVQKQLNHPAI